MSRTVFSLALLAALAVGSTVAGGLLKGKPKTDAARARVLIETLKSDPDEKRRKAAADELGGVDPRQVPEVATALAAALQKDASAAVRAEAAESLGQINQVFPVAGLALEAAAAGDASPAVRTAAKRALWEYHLAGYRSPKGADGVAFQTIEPPIASPAGPRPVAAVVPAAPPPAPVTPLIPPLPTAAPTPPSLPPVAPPNGPRVSRPFLADLMPGPRAATRERIDAAAPPILNVTPEPPIARPRAVTLIPPPAPMPSVTVEPPPAPAVRAPDYAPTLPPFKPDLPSVVLPPDATPVPIPVPTVPRLPATLPPR